MRTLANQGANVKAYDPVAMENAEREIRGVTLADNAYDVAEGADALVLLTDWNEFKQLDMARIKGMMREPLLVDGRNIYDPDAMRELGFVYRGVGRGYNGEGVANGHAAHEDMAPVAGD